MGDIFVLYKNEQFFMGEEQFSFHRARNLKLQLSIFLLVQNPIEVFFYGMLFDPLTRTTEHSYKLWP